MNLPSIDLQNIADNLITGIAYAWIMWVTTKTLKNSKDLDGAHRNIRKLGHVFTSFRKNNPTDTVEARNPKNVRNGDK